MMVVQHTGSGRVLACGAVGPWFKARQGLFHSVSGWCIRPEGSWVDLMLEHFTVTNAAIFYVYQNQAWQKYLGTRPEIFQDPGMNSLSGLPEFQCKQRSVADFDTFHNAFVIFTSNYNNNKMNKIMINKFQKIGFQCVCKFKVLVHLTFRYAKVLTNFIFIQFLLQKSLISAQAHDENTRIPAWKLHTQPGYINTRIFSGLIKTSNHDKFSFPENDICLQLDS